jgi:hypothetical protein
MVRVTMMSAVIVVCGCGGGGTFEERTLQSSCVHDNITSLARTVADGSECSNFSYSDCGGDPFPMASECANYCAFDVCQPAQCQGDSECAAFGALFECMDYVVSEESYGSWCGESDCPKGTPGCPCREGDLCVAPDDLWVVTCTAGVCDGTDTCPAGCRSGSVCCGGAFCGGDCVGTPCC